MPTFTVAMWYPTINGDDLWGELSLADKLEQLTLAVTAARAHFGGEAFQGIFAAPEYTLTAGGTPRPREIPIPVRETAQLFNSLEALSRTIPRVLFIPGSMMVVADGAVQNRAIGYYGGESVIFCGKRDGVGEVVQAHRFTSGNGGASATVAGLRFGLQICRDASRVGYLAADVDVHVVVSAGLALSNIVDPGNARARVVVLAERGGASMDRQSGGVEYNQNANQPRAVVALTDRQVAGADVDFRLMKTVVVNYNP